jgi:hypothetical protein
MMIVSYRFGQKYYPIPYPWKKLASYIFICIVLFVIHFTARNFIVTTWVVHSLGVLLLTLFVLFILKIEKSEFQKLPFVGRYIK